MSSKPKAPNTIHVELTDLKTAIADANRRVGEYEEDRKATNADISSIVENLEAKGIHRKAFKWARMYASWDAETRAGFDTAYSLVREALGVPYEDQLFDAEGQPNLKPKAEAKPAKAEAKDQTQEIAQTILGQVESVH